MIFVAQPFADESTCVNFRVLPTRQVEPLCDFLVRLLKSSGICSMNPEHLAVLMFESVGKFNSYLRFPELDVSEEIQKLVINWTCRG